MFPTWWRALAARRPLSTPRGRFPSRQSHAAFRPRLEWLEDRTLLSAGGLDLSFGGAGKVNTPFAGPSGDNAQALAVQADGKIVAAGYTNANAAVNDFAVVRYNTDGSLD